MNPETKKISFVIPVYNEVKCLNELYNRIVSNAGKTGYFFEIVFVDDGSSDGSYSAIQKIKERDERVRGVKFSRNFGHQMALLCGLEHAAGDVIIMMDADLQHPPELIPELIKQWESGIPIVNTIRKSVRSESLFKKCTSDFFYEVFSILTGLKIGENTADFRLLDRKVVEQIKSVSESVLFLRGMITWIGFKQTSIHYVPAARFAGETKYNLRKMLEFGIDGLTSFSILPLRFATVLGLLIIVINLIYLMYALLVFFVFGGTEKGWTSVVFIISLYSAIQIFLIGLVGEYIAKIHLETKKRPRYIIEESF